MCGLRFPRSLPPPLFLDRLVPFHLLLAVSLLSDVFGMFLISACSVLLFCFVFALTFQTFCW